MTTQLLWLRCDLRSRDNTALSAAMAAGPTVALYIVTPKQWLAHDDAPCKVDFWLRNLRLLGQRLAQLNVPLLVRHCDDWSGVPDVLAQVCRQHEVRAVHLNQEYGVNESRRDAAVAERLRADNIALHSHLDQLLFAPGTLLTRSDSYFQVFGQFRRLCHARLQLAVPAVLATPAAQAPLAIASDPLPEGVEHFAATSAQIRQYWPAGEDSASRALNDFAEQRLHDYQANRDFPALDGTSQLSPYLAAGVLSPRQCLHAALRINQGEFDSGSPGVVCWIGELLWREFYKHVLVGFPRVSMHRAFRRETDTLPWRHAPEELAAWQAGNTGFPLIDAAMRQLRATGWMHNRLRMLVAMFLSKNLLIDWREGERWFMRHLIDGDLAANNGGWQWSASTGTDSVPYFRLFNPLSQSRRFDPDGSFIRTWVPELAHLSARDIHDPAALGGLFGAPSYPRPMVDLARSRERALSAFKNLAELRP